MNDIFENTETMKENEHPRFYTAESVMRGHPDKLCDLIADSVLDECLKHDPASRVACEVMATRGHIIVAGEEDRIHISAPVLGAGAALLPA